VQGSGYRSSPNRRSIA